MRTALLISLLSAVVVTASEPSTNQMNLASVACTAANVGTTCNAWVSAWTEVSCATVSTRLVSTPGTVAYSATQCIPKQALTGNVTVGSYTLTITSLASTGSLNLTTCTSESSCDANSCCVQIAHSVNGTAANTGMVCGARTAFLDEVRASNVGIASTATAAPANTIAVAWACTKTLNPVAYEAKWESDATFFKFSMAVIFGLLALFAY